MEGNGRENKKIGANPYFSPLLLTQLVIGLGETGPILDSSGFCPISLIPLGEFFCKNMRKCFPHT